MNRQIDRRIAKLEVVRDAKRLGPMIDRPPEVTREEWLAYRAGAPLPSSLTKVNERGETREQWLERRRRELGMSPN
jgi:hypothetical protein